MGIENTALKPIAAAASPAVQLRDYQLELDSAIDQAWAAGSINVAAVLPTGGGKTQILANKVRNHQGDACVIAHRQELVCQISLALGSFGVRHKIIGPQKLVKFIVGEHVRKLGKSWYDANAQTAVAGVDTLVKRTAQLDHWCRGITLWVQDECHHILRKNKWGKAAEMFPNAKGLGFTATFERADGKGLGRDADGVMDTIVEGPTQRDLINLGWLVDYVIYAPPSDLNVTDEDIGSTGDYSQPKMAKAAKESHIVGDVVKHFQRYAPGRRGVTFCTDVETAERVANEYHAAGVAAQCVSAKTDDAIRTDATNKLADGRLAQLTNVDLFGEGYDLPAIDCVSMARPTASFGLFVQQIGRALRPVFAPGMPLDTPEQRKAAIAASAKPYAIVIDHVNNVLKHAVARQDPLTGNQIIDVCYREWSLQGKEKRQSTPSDDAIPLTVCTNPQCNQPYERVKPKCPWCGHAPEPEQRSGPEWVDGDLTQLDPSALASIVEQQDPPFKEPQWQGEHVKMAARKRHAERTQAQDELRDLMAWWAGYQRAYGRGNAEIYRLFYWMFGVDMATAKTLRRKEAAELAERVSIKLAEYMT